MAKVAEMFLSELSVVDHAYINEFGNVVGGSYNPTFFVAGDIDPVENVVVDFSTIKKDIKKIIDCHNTGFDHKLWLIEGYSACDMTINTTLNTVLIETPTTQLMMPQDAVKVVYQHSSEFTRGHNDDYIGEAFAAQVQEVLREQYGPSIRVICFNNTNIHSPVGSPNSAALFTYVHGLKDSTSYGCQNVSHGHLSFIQSIPSTLVTSNLISAIAADLDGVIFINKANVISDDGHIITISYETPRGYFEASYEKESYKIIVLETETTIEHLVDYIAMRYQRDLTNVGVEVLFVSEGLSKGAVKRLM